MAAKRIEKSYTNVEAMNIIHQVSNFYVSTKRPKDYGTGEEYTSVEAHTLMYIADHPGITVTQIALDYGKTKGAVSQILKKIESRGLICRGSRKGKSTVCPFYLTEKGREFDKIHREYDAVRSGESLDQIRAVYTEEEVNSAFSVLEAWLYVRRDVHQKRLKEEALQKKNRE